MRCGAIAVLLVAVGVSSAMADTISPPVVGGGEPNLRMTNDVRVYQMTKDAVVNISSTKIVQARVSSGNPIFDQMGGGIMRDVQAQSLGSGFVIHSAGYIVTNEHVVDQATDVQVTFFNGDKLEATVLATDNEHDLAVLKVNPKKPLPAISLGVSDDLMIGEPVYAIGNPFGYAGTMTRGIVSAVNRELDAGEGKKYTGLIQTDASINPGNSGGPLINAYGQVVGINTAIRADAHGIGFAIAVSNMRDLLPDFLNPLAMKRAQVGFTVREARVIQTPGGGAAVASEILVKNVDANSAAYKAGLREGDRVESVNKTPASSIVDVLVSLSDVKAGDELSLVVMHAQAGKAEAVSFAAEKAPAPPVEDLLLTKLGVEAKTVTAALAKSEHLPVQRGVLITGVKADSAAANAGIEPGDVLYQMGPYYVGSTEDVSTLLKTVKQEIAVRVGIVRGNTRGRGIVQLH